MNELVGVDLEIFEQVTPANKTTQKIFLQWSVACFFLTSDLKSEFALGFIIANCHPTVNPFFVHSFFPAKNEVFCLGFIAAYCMFYVILLIYILKQIMASSVAGFIHQRRIELEHFKSNLSEPDLHFFITTEVHYFHCGQLAALQSGKVSLSGLIVFFKLFVGSLHCRNFLSSSVSCWSCRQASRRQSFAGTIGGLFRKDLLK